MSHHRYRQAGYAVVAITTVVYAGLICLISSCSVALLILSGGHEHHDHHATHSALCAWACQAMSDFGLVVRSPALATGPVVQLVEVSVDHLVPLLSLTLLHSRAPPSVSLIILG
jgi:hypothetical protein